MRTQTQQTRSPITPLWHVRRVACLFLAIFTILAAFVAPAQEPGIGQDSAKLSAAAVPGVAESRLQTGRHDSQVVTLDNSLSFLPPVLYDSGGGAVSAAIADVNGDGKADLLVANSNSGTVGVLLGNGDGTFQPATTYGSGGPNPYSIVVADVNGDGKPDVLVGNADDSTVGVLLGNGNGTFQPAVTYSLGGFNLYSLAVADMNGDGKPDLVVVIESLVGVLLGNGDGTFQAVVTYGTGGLFSTSLAAADVNGDGRPDLIVSNSSGGVGVLLGKGDGTLLPAVTYPTGGESEGLEVADVNEDGKPDVVVANYSAYTVGTVGVLVGNGDGTFQPPVTYSSGGEGPWKVAVADVNGDGRPDVLVVNRYSQSVGMLAGNGDGTFQTPVTYPSGGDTFSVLATDLNGDGKPDLVLADLSFGCNCSNPGGLALLISAKGPRSPTTTSVTPSANPVAPHQTVTYTATVKKEIGGQATGAVTFSDGTKAIAIVGLVGNQASWTTEYATTGAHIVTATYSGDAKTAGSTSAGFTEHITVLPVSSTTRVASSGSPSLLGHPVTFTATVTPYYGFIPDGELVTFYDGTTTLASVPLMSEMAAYSTSSLSATTHFIKVTYAGSATFRPSLGRVQQVVDKYPTTTTLTSNLNPSIFGESLTFTATATSSGGTIPTGRVAFTWSTYTIGTATLNSSGVCTLTKSKVNADLYPLTAVYLGDAANATSTSAILNQVVEQTTSAATLSSSPNPSTQGQAVTFTAKISSPTVIPTGPVTFTAGKTVLGTAQLSGGKATLTISLLAVGSTKVTATYYGDSNIAKSSASLTQTVQ